MAKSTHQKQLDRARANRAHQREQMRRGTRVIVSVVAGIVVLALAFAAVLMVRGDGDDVAAGDELEGFDESADDGAETDEGAATDTGAATDGSEADATVTEPSVEPCPVPERELPEPTTTPYASEPTTDLGDSPTVTARLSTTCGEVVLALDAAAAPLTVTNFVALAEDGYYDGVGFHRVIDGFMVQGGDPTGTGTGCVDGDCSTRLPGYSFADELGLAQEVVEANGGYPRGTLAMANAGPDTNGSQFFIVQADPSYPLPPAYAVFGEVVEGMDVVDRIAVGPAVGDQAIDPVVILGVTVDRCAPGEC